MVVKVEVEVTFPKSVAKLGHRVVQQFPENLLRIFVDLQVIIRLLVNIHVDVFVTSPEVRRKFVSKSFHVRSTAHSSEEVDVRLVYGHAVLVG